MKFVIKIFEIFKKPSPFGYNSIVKNIFGSITFGIFIFLFLSIFKPFGIHLHSGKDLLKFTSRFGIITSAYLIIHFVIIELFFSEKKWTFGKEIINIHVIIAMIGLSNYVYDDLIYFPGQFKLNELIKFQLETLAVGLIPIFLFCFFKRNRLLKKYLQEAKEINQKKGKKIYENKCDKLVTISAQNPKNDFACNCNDILFFLAQDNYVIVNYIKDSCLSKQIIRTTLKQTQDNLSDYPDFYRCHKSYIVNLDKVINVSGNAQGLRLQLDNTDEIIPVSRQLHQEFTEIYCTN